jgi:hypothetical protein
MSSTRLGYRELGIEIVSLKDNFSFQLKKPTMAEEKRNEGAKDPIKLFLTEALVKHRNKMLEIFSQILLQFLIIKCMY